MPLSHGEDFLYDLIKGALAMTGGTLGAGAGGVGGAGIGAVPGAMAGSALGYGAGESIKNFAKEMQNQPIDIMSPVKVLPEGAAMEAGGQMLGKGLRYLGGKLIDKAAPTSEAVQNLINSLKRNASGKLETVFHGSTESIPNPNISQTQTGLGGNTFYTTPLKPMAEAFAEFRKLREPFFNDRSKIPSVINEYYQRPVQEAALNYDTAPEIGQKLGITPDKIQKAIEFEIGFQRFCLDSSQDRSTIIGPVDLSP